MAAPEVMLLAGTRPEGIKLAPLHQALTAHDRLRPYLVDTGQQPGRVGEATAPFGIKPDADLILDRVTGSLAELAAGLSTALDPLLAERRPAAVVVQGDTTTALMGGLVAFWHRIPVVHLEAGLRTFDNGRPFPEECNRAVLGRFAALHLAPTEAARAHLLAERVDPATIAVTGNTVVDAQRYLLDEGLATPPTWLDRTRPVVVATMHRRENWGEGVDSLLVALTGLAKSRPDAQIVVVTHPNPRLGARIRDGLGAVEGVRVLPTLPYDAMLGLLSAATLVVTDSGGLQEEAATLGVPMVVTRDATERPEALVPGYGVLAGTDPARILAGALGFLASPPPPHGESPFGDGHAGTRCAGLIADLLHAADSVPPARVPSSVADLDPVGA